MSKPFDRLQSVLKLEAQQGYKNKAVVGGIRQFVSFWVEQAREEAIDEADAAFIEQTAQALTEYAQTSGNGRRMLITRLIDKLDERKSKLSDASAPPATEAQESTNDAAAAHLESVEQAINQQIDSQTSDISNQGSQQSEPVSLEPIAESQVKEPVKSQASKAKIQNPNREIHKPNSAGLNQSILKIKGVGPKMIELFEKLNVHTIEDLLHLYPRRYDDYTTMKPINRLEYGEKVSLIGTIWEVRSRKSRNNQVVVQAVISDGTGKISATWYNQPWLMQKLRSGLRVVLSGTVEQYLGRKVFNSPSWELLSMDALRHGQIVSIYPLTKGLSNYRVQQIAKTAVNDWAQEVIDPVPEDIRQRQRMPSLAKALKQIHIPDSADQLITARRRLMFDELFFLQLGMMGQQHDWAGSPGRTLNVRGEQINNFIHSLPFIPTKAQTRVIVELENDLKNETPMNRLLQGDVGAGKTVVAAAAIVGAISAGTQTALMAPTEILAEQHFNGLSKLLERMGYTLALLTGSVRAAEKREVYAKLMSGDIDLVIGTHALIQEDVAFKNLGLAVIDEQHRFGVDQRAALRNKGPEISGEQITPNLLVMSATPIPRSLALTLFGDLNLSILDEMPPGRQQIDTHWIRPTARERTYAFVRGQIEKGRQAYVICPLVEESEKLEAVAAVEEYERLSAVIFPDLKLGLVHGKMKSAEKEAVMREFYAGEINILVSTTVIEVGVDVPNSTVMMIENANRFGLAQLHQLRGRVGRGEHKSYCLLVAETTSSDSEERLRALEQTNDGFELAEKDLELRGPGEFFGRRQSGIPELQLASFTEKEMLDAARKEAEQLFNDDPGLERPEHKDLHDRVIQFWENAGDIS
ncbi:MAG: ATP-dependent DNA helicase RecG [Chloroflexota bacterium]